MHCEVFTDVSLECFCDCNGFDALPAHNACLVVLSQAKEVSPEGAALATEFLQEQDASRGADANSADFEDIWKHYGEVRLTAGCSASTEL